MYASVFVHFRQTSSGFQLGHFQFQKFLFDGVLTFSKLKGVFWSLFLSRTWNFWSYNSYIVIRNIMNSERISTTQGFACTSLWCQFCTGLSEILLKLTVYSWKIVFHSLKTLTFSDDLRRNEIQPVAFLPWARWCTFMINT